MPLGERGSTEERTVAGTNVPDCLQAQAELFLPCGGRHLRLRQVETGRPPTFLPYHRYNKFVNPCFFRYNIKEQGIKNKE